MAKISVAEIAEIVGKRHNLAAKDMEKFISVMFRVLNKGLDSEKQVKIKGLGTFKIMSVKPRESINVNTGERVVIEGHDKISFTPDAAMRDVVNKPFAQFETVVLKDEVDFADIEHCSEEEEKAEDIIGENDNADGIPTESREIGNGEDAKAEDTGPIGKSEPAREDIADKEVIASENADKTYPNMVPMESLDELREEMEAVLYDNKCKSRRNIVFAAIISVVCFIGGMVLGIYFDGLDINGKNSREMSGKPSATVYVTKKTALKKTSEPAKTTVVEPEKNEPDFDKMNADPRVKYGAYRIVGIDTVITLRGNQTMESYCRATLGSGMLCYFQVLNDTAELGKGAVMKVPKVKLK